MSSLTKEREGYAITPSQQYVNTNYRIFIIKYLYLPTMAAAVIVLLKVI